MDYLKEAVLGEEKQRERQEIDVYTAQLRPLASTANGEFVLTDLLSNQAAPKVQRAAAAQALNPGMEASIGVHGELSFTSKPGASLGYTLPEPNRANEQATQGQVVAGQQGDVVSKFDTTFRSMQAATDIVEVENTYAQLNAGATSYIAGKQAEVRTRVRTSLGLNQLEAQIAADKQLDIDFWASRGEPYQGPTDESMANLQLLRSQEAKVDKMVDEELATNPDIAALRSRLQGAETLVQQKRNIAGSQLEGASKKDDIGASVLPERVEAAALALGADASNPRAAAEIRAQLATGNGPANTAESLASMSTIQLVGLATTNTTEAGMANRVLASKFPNKADVEYIVTQVKNFDQLYLPNMSEDERAQFAPSVTNAMASANAQKQEAQAIQARKTQYVMDRFQALRTDSFAAGLGNMGEGGWDAPTDPMLAELPQVIADIKKAEPEKAIDINLLTSRMSWSTDIVAKSKALANYVYSQALREPNNSALGMPTGYHDPLAIEKMIQAQIVLVRTAHKPNYMYNR